MRLRKTEANNLSLKWPIQGIHSLHGYVVNVEYSKVITVFLRGFDRMLMESSLL